MGAGEPRARPAAPLNQPVATAGHGRGWLLLLLSTADAHSSYSADPDPDIGEIIAYDAISPDDASWAGPNVVNLLVKQQVAEHHGLHTEGSYLIDKDGGKLISELSPALMYKLLDRFTALLPEESAPKFDD